MKATGICFAIFTLNAGIALAVGPTSDDFYNAIRANDLMRLRSLVHDSADANTKDGRGETPLMYAAVAGSVEAMKFLIGKGADVNAQNEFGSSALIWSATDLAKVKLLLAHGANVNTVSKRGRTALFLAAMTDRSAETVRLLLAKGADPKITDSIKNTILIAAAAGNDNETIRLIIDAGVDVNAANVLGLTPLIVSAGDNGNVRAVKMLLAKGAHVNAVSPAPFLFPSLSPKAGTPQFGSITALGMAAPFGPPELVKTLLDAGAAVNVKDVRDMTPLMLAVGTDHQDPEIIRMLLDHGAKLEPKSILGETANDWARKIALPPAIQLLKTKTEDAPRAIPVAVVAALEPRTAVERSVALLERTTHQFFANSGCAACHSQGMTDMAVAEARAKGIRVDESAARERVQMVKIQYPAEALYERMDLLIPEITGYSTAGLAAMSYAPDKMTDAMASVIAVQQLANGSWHYGGNSRPPAEEGDIFRTALSIRALKTYGPPARATEMNARIAKAKQWLLSAKAINAEDRNMQMLGLHWAAADARELGRLTKAILALQQSDGGWRQRDEFSSDAYATGESLYTLASAGGIAPTDPAYQKGVKFLLSTQAEDGSWHVVSRAPKFQVYFESGFPYGGDQWISAWATGWASMALAQAIPPSPVAQVSTVGQVSGAGPRLLVSKLTFEKRRKFDRVEFGFRGPNSNPDFGGFRHESSMQHFRATVGIVAAGEFEQAVRQHKAERHARGFTCWGQLVAMLFCHVGQARSLREICQGLAASEGKLRHLGIPKAPQKSTLAYANEHRPWQLYETVFHQLLGRCVSEAKGRKKFRFKNKLVSLDSTSIDLCASVFDWARYKRTKGAVKLHLVLDHEGYLPCFAVLTDGQSHDVTVGRTLTFQPGTIVAMDKGYVDYLWWKQMSESGVYFVTRLKEDLKYQAVGERAVPQNSNVRSDRDIRIQPYRQDFELKLRVVTIWDEEKEQELSFLTNHLDFGSTTVARIYKERWQIELFFKSLKQLLRVRTFVGTSANALKTQMWTALIAMLLLKYLQLRSSFGWSLSNLVALVRQQLFVYRDLFAWLDDPFQAPPVLAGVHDVQIPLLF